MPTRKYNSTKSKSYKKTSKRKMKTYSTKSKALPPFAEEGLVDRNYDNRNHYLVDVISKKGGKTRKNAMKINRRKKKIKLSKKQK